MSVQLEHSRIQFPLVHFRCVHSARKYTVQVHQTTNRFAEDAMEQSKHELRRMLNVEHTVREACRPGSTVSFEDSYLKIKNKPKKALGSARRGASLLLGLSGAESSKDGYE